LTVAYLENIFGPTSARLGRAMNLASERQGLLMKNLANVNVPGYKREDMDFNLRLDEAMGAEADEFDQAFAKGRVRHSESQSSQREDKNSVDLEAEVMSIAETEHRFLALTEMTSRYYSGLKSVIREGR
jgi:flagellar basal-body rod protein FlgB